MPGIVFYKTAMLEKISEFYTGILGFELWLDQGKCKILKKENMLIGFCSGAKAEKETFITLFYPSRKEVDAMYKKLQDIADVPPRLNKAFRIYQFFAKDPEARILEFQHFEHEIDFEF
jgi:hypothetical protein